MESEQFGQVMTAMLVRLNALRGKQNTYFGLIVDAISCPVLKGRVSIDRDWKMSFLENNLMDGLPLICITNFARENACYRGYLTSRNTAQPAP
ncbi:MAG: hypothetical protein HOH43_22910 [Candidatus Latescibacteria bacterium]|nr:hypothetical protein [Candidatus Latescibacterota bacterium]